MKYYGCHLRNHAEDNTSTLRRFWLNEQSYLGRLYRKWIEKPSSRLSILIDKQDTGGARPARSSESKLENSSLDSNEPRYSIETLVEALYRGILSRMPDEKGFSSNIRYLMVRGATATDLGTCVKGFLSSQEHQNKAFRQFSHKLLNTSAMLNGEPIDIVSLGSHCLVSYALKEMGLKRYSCPFDWIFSCPSMVEHCKKDSFSMLTDRSQYKTVINESGTEMPGRCDHAFYKDTLGVKWVFNHRDMRIEENYEYLLRCIDRFEKLLASERRKTFVLLSLDSSINFQQFVSLHDTLSRSTSNFGLIVMKLESPRNDICDFGIDCIKSIGRSCLATMRPMSKPGPFAFEDPFDDVMFRRAIVAFGVKAENPMTQEISLCATSCA